MKSITRNLLKLFRKIYFKIFREKILQKPVCEQDPHKVSEMIYDLLISNKPVMVARFGSTELSMLVNYKGIKEKDKSLVRYVAKNGLPWWWESKRMEQMQDWSGFFPPTEEKISEFCELMLQDLKEVDILGSWLADENYFLDQMNCELVRIEILNPYFARKPWTRALKDKKVLVIHPFADLIEYQYENSKEYLFENKDILPHFELKTIKAVQSLGGVANGFENWFEALEWMKKEIDKCDYDICLIGAGAYGFPLASYVKKQGKKSVHIGGSLQLLFGIKGKRWEDPNYSKDLNYAALMNKYWVRPGEEFKPKNAEDVEGACYW